MLSEDGLRGLVFFFFFSLHVLMSSCFKEFHRWQEQATTSAARRGRSLPAVSSCLHKLLSAAFAHICSVGWSHPHLSPSHQGNHFLFRKTHHRDPFIRFHVMLYMLCVCMCMCVWERERPWRHSGCVHGCHNPVSLFLPLACSIFVSSVQFVKEQFVIHRWNEGWYKAEVRAPTCCFMPRQLCGIISVTVRFWFLHIPIMQNKGYGEASRIEGLSFCSQGILKFQLTLQRPVAGKTTHALWSGFIQMHRALFTILV